MHTVKTLTLTVVAAVLLGVAPQARAQDMAQIQLMQTFLDLMTQYYAIIESTHDIASDSEKAAIMQMQKIQEVYEDRGD